MTQGQGFLHIPVLANEVSKILVTKPEGVYVDGTFGRGGHSKLILNKLDSNGCLYAFDRDPAAVESAQQNPYFNTKHNNFKIIHATFADMEENLAVLGVNRVSGILLDIGISSPQIDDPQRGFSFRLDGPLDMRMDNTSGVPASQWIDQADEEEIARVIREFGEENYAKPIAHEIVKQRQISEISTTKQLAAVIEKVVPKSRKDYFQNPATRTFQAIRIYINDELGQLKQALNAAGKLLEAEGVLAVITFHSLEEKIVKQFFESCSNPQSKIDPRLPLRADQLPKPLFSKPKKVVPSIEEIVENPRARTSTLRYAVRTDVPWEKGVEL